MDNLKFEEVKQKMREYRDLYGCELDQKAIDDAKNIFDLDDVFIRHFNHIEMAANDAIHNLGDFKKELNFF